MSLLEDIFLRDEADEARELERIIEGDEYDDNDKPRIRSDSDDNSEKEDEAEEEKRRVDPSSTKTKRAVKNPRVVLNPARLTGPRGFQVIPEHFKDFKFKGKGFEKEDLDLVLKKLEHWAYRLYPKFQFEDCLKKIETLGKKRPVMVHLHKIRSDQYSSEETVVQKDSSDDDTAMVEKEEDEFDKLLRQQIELARSTPEPGLTKKNTLESSTMSRSTLTMVTKVTSSPSISEEQRERMMKSRKMAEERRLARLKNNNTVTNSGSHEKDSTSISSNQETNKHGEDISKNNVETTIFEDVTITGKHNRSNIIDSSDDEDRMISVNVPIVADIHTSAHDNDTEVRKLVKTYSRHRKLDNTHVMNNTQNERESNEIGCLETQINVKTDHLSKELQETCEEPIKLADNVQTDDGDGINSMETESLVVDNEEIEKQIAIIEKEDDVDNSEQKKTLNFVEDISVINSNESNENKSKEIFESNENIVKLDERQNATKSRISIINEEVNEDLDDLMDVDFSDDF